MSMTINVHVLFDHEPRTVKVRESSTAEDIIIGVCKLLEIGPIARHLFGLKNYSTNSWLDLSHKMMEHKDKDFEIAIRYNVPDANRLISIDKNAYDFYFKQAKYLLLHDKISSIDYDTYQARILGLSIVDMHRALCEEEVTREDVIRNYKKYAPERAKKRHCIFLRKPIVQTFSNIKPIECDAEFCKSIYLEEIQNMAPDYLSEEYNVIVDDMNSVCSVSLRVSPFDLVFPGINVKQENKTEWEHVCTIEDLLFINARDDGNVEIGRKTGRPYYIKFNMVSTVKDFVSLLDGYYRLMVKWTFSLCRECTSPSLIKLLKMRCHGPVGGMFAYRKLRELRNNEVGCFILRESDIAYDTYYMDVCVKSNPGPVTYKIEMTDDKKYKLIDKDKIYSSLRHLINDYRDENGELFLRECLPPFEDDDSNLLLCRIPDGVRKKKKPVQELKITKPICINIRNLMIFKNMPKDGKSPFTVVYPGYWIDPTDTKRNVAIKALNENFQKGSLMEFLALTNRWVFVNSGAIVKLYGFTLQKPISMIMELLPLGQLDHYLTSSENHSKISDINLFEASMCLANALFYLEEANVVHGKIRCRKLLVASHNDNSLVVKLSDPGMRTPYEDIDLHWIPPENHNNPNDARSSSAADVWALATTVWEIFNWGKLPPNGNASAIKKFYAHPGKHLVLPASCPRILCTLIEDCWNYDVESRKKPQVLMRDINHIFYRVFNSRKPNPYVTITTPHQAELDSDSNYKKTNDDFSTAPLSEPTVNTFLNDADDENSADLTSSNLTLSTNLTYQVTNSSMYRCVTDKNEIMAFVNQQNQITESDNPVSSLQSIFKLDKEWNLILTGRIGEGFYGEVYRGKLLHMYEDEEQEVAVKKLKAEAMNKSDFDREISIMLKLEHPNIVRIRGIVQDPELCLVLEYVEHGSLQCYLSIYKERLTQHHLLKFALDVARGMSYLSDMKLIHRDLAARNILVVDERSVKISDFGLARFIKNGDYYILTTQRDLPIKWYAPESLEFGKFSTQSDVWSYGVTLYEMFSFGADPQLPGVEQTAEEIQKALKNNLRLPMPTQCSQFIYAHVMSPCWKYAANSRPTFDELRKTIEDILPIT